MKLLSFYHLALVILLCDFLIMANILGSTLWIRLWEVFFKISVVSGVGKMLWSKESCFW